ncbi:MAG TPA: cupredoxin domain-containing protein [Actinomycetota bacterium]|nr:cupredoxin domain-containing protein [Actinomycetota bacterium]
MRLRSFPLLLLVWLMMLIPPAGAADLKVEATDNLFAPSALSAAVGDTVTFTNTGKAPHNVQFKDASQKGLDILNPGASNSITLNKAGTFDYVCSFHAPDMKGTITVAGASEASGGDAGPTAAPTEQETSDAASVTEESPAADGEKDETEPVAADVPPSEKYFPKAGFGLFVLLLVLIGIGFLRYTMKSAETKR